jgi:hypothetical protein
MSNGNNPNDPVAIPQATLEYRVHITNNFTGEDTTYVIPLPAVVALQYNHVVTTGIIAVLDKGGEILTTVAVDGDTAAKVSELGKEFVDKIEGA